MPSALSHSDCVPRVAGWKAFCHERPEYSLSYPSDLFHPVPIGETPGALAERSEGVGFVRNESDAGIGPVVSVSLSPLSEVGAPSIEWLDSLGVLYTGAGEVTLRGRRYLKWTDLTMGKDGFELTCLATVFPPNKQITICATSLFAEDATFYKMIESLKFSSPTEGAP